ncbi:MAG TPA: acetyl-CoA carboxylase biotin carboxyl carrier protein subunit [Pseudogracilibacillus sp.]|nr:acetyl-CoA carboxylase biotin carboxyl carrier protein subunit [Pseudogracilibacillus sp.]
MEIKAEMAGNLWKLLVAEGETVTSGQDVAILESMKMEIPVSANQDGVLKELKRTEGDFLNEGDIIAVLE